MTAKTSERRRGNPAGARFRRVKGSAPRPAAAAAAAAGASAALALVAALAPALVVALAGAALLEGLPHRLLLLLRGLEHDDDMAYCSQIEALPVLPVYTRQSAGPGAGPRIKFQGRLAGARKPAA